MIIPIDTLIALIIVSFLAGMLVMLLLVLLGLKIMDRREDAHVQFLRQAHGENQAGTTADPPTKICNGG